MAHSVEDSLPEPYAYVLIWLDEQWQMGFLNDEGLWYIEWIGDCVPHDEVTHWHPLPEAPQGAVS